ncbi:MAG: HEAT repeat domain-containing protein [Planctomycetes bacterium]|nr:HEAT repeat domain-containing protein [Planctomycetota bacterium]
MHRRAANVTSFALAAAWCAACAGPAPVARTAPQHAPPTAEQLQLCREVELAYRSGGDDYEALRERAIADPVTAMWLSRMFVRDIAVTREGRELPEHEDPRARADARAETRALGELHRLGAVAVPTLIDDLLCHSLPQRRELGIELVARAGAPAVPAVRELARSSDPRQRRAAGRVLAAIGAAGDVLPVLRELAADPEFTVRADALRELHDGGAPARALLIERLRDDDDPFVRSTAAEALARFPGAASAHALVDHLERCQRAGDLRGELVAQNSLQALAGVRKLRTVAEWRTFAAQQRDPD